ncbi:RNase P subunit p30 family protein [Halomarina litorea]|uniref:RNase P subunit p30 family protein n=1 Tax=Halomarina litorea TaxID=2961595 RepID=UPI0020C1F594|nr:RNase P subunit p30 family protein [Halomarina sp. BCD28]
MSGAYETAHPHPDGDSTVARLALTAAEQGYDGLVVRTHADGEAESYDPTAIGERYGLDVVAGVEIRAADRGRVASAIGTERDRRTVVCVHGGEHNRLACEDPRVDVLAHPMADGDVNHVLANAAADNGVRLEFDFGPVLRTTGGERVRALRGLRKLREIVTACDAPYVVSADARSHLHLRAPRELVAVGEQIGFTREQVESGLAEWGRLAERNRERASDSFIEPGVRRGRYEEDD